MKLKKCPICEQYKSLTEFHKDKTKKLSIASRCKECKCRYVRTVQKHRDRTSENSYKQWMKDNAEGRSERVYNNFLKRTYGMTLADYDLMLETQGGVCAICKKVNRSGRRLAVDHCHETSIVRGLLCTKCNIGLGSFADSIELMKTAIDYLAD